MTDLLLVNPYLAIQNKDRQRILKPYFPLGLLYIASYLKERSDIRVRVFDAGLPADGADLAQELRDCRPRMVGVYCTNFSRANARRSLLQARASGAFVVAGGPDPSEYPEVYFGWGADAIVKGEGEETCRDLLENLQGKPGCYRLREPATIPGLIYLDDGSVRSNPDRPLIKDLDSLPDPDWCALDLERHFKVWKRLFGYTSLSLLTSRGCPLWCTWCSKTVFGQTYRKRSVGRVAAEMKRLKDSYAPDYLLIADDVFTMNRHWLIRLSQEIRRSGAGIPFECIGRPEQLTDDVVDALQELGCARVYLGAESGSQGVLDGMMKGFTVEDVRAAASRLRARNIQFGAFVMLGFPGETATDILRTGDLLGDIRPDFMGVSRVYPIKGTTFHVDVRAGSTRRSDPALSDGADPHRGRYFGPFYWFAQRYLEKCMTVHHSGPGLRRCWEELKRFMNWSGLRLLSVCRRSEPVSVPVRMVNARLITNGKRPVAA